MATIKFNYTKAMNDANQLDEYANLLSRIADNDIESLINSLNSVWKGDGATLLINKCINQQVQLKDYVKKLKDASSSLRLVAKRIREAEEQAIAAQEKNFK